MKIEPKPILVKKSVKHTFTPEEVATLNVDFGQAYDAVRSAEADFDAVKAVHKAKIQEAETKMVLLRATINAGFEYRETELVVVFRPADKKKDYYLPIPPGDPFYQPWLKGVNPVLTEDMEPDDFQRDLIQAESIFSDRKEIELWASDQDRGLIIVGQLAGRWYSALRCNVGVTRLEERLDSEQKSTKQRGPAILCAVSRVNQWLDSFLDKDTVKGFQEDINDAVKAEQEKVE